MRGASIYDDAAAGVPEALEAVDLAGARIANLSDEDFTDLLAELGERAWSEPLPPAETLIYDLCKEESFKRDIRARFHSSAIANETE